MSMPIADSPMNTVVPAEAPCHCGALVDEKGVIVDHRHPGEGRVVAVEAEVPAAPVAAAKKKASGK